MPYPAAIGQRPLEVREAYAALEQLWLSEHPYELPELIAVPIASGLEAYLQWISHAVSPC